MKLAAGTYSQISSVLTITISKHQYQRKEGKVSYYGIEVEELGKRKWSIHHITIRIRMLRFVVGLRAEYVREGKLLDKPALPSRQDQDRFPREIAYTFYAASGSVIETKIVTG